MHATSERTFFRVFELQTLVVARGLCHALQNRVSAALRTLATAVLTFIRISLMNGVEPGCDS
jgi:hypothetical protein